MSDRRRPTAAEESPEVEKITISSVLSEFKNLFVNIDFKRILCIVRHAVEKIKKEKENFSKFAILIEAVIEIFD